MASNAHAAEPGQFSTPARAMALPRTGFVTPQGNGGAHSLHVPGRRANRPGPVPGYVTPQGGPKLFSQRARLLFDRYDENKDGVLSLEEFGNCLERGFGCLPLDAATNTHELFADLDRHNNGYIERAMYMQFMETPEAPQIIHALGHDLTKRTAASLSAEPGLDNYLVDLVRSHAPQTPNGSRMTVTPNMRKAAIKGTVQNKLRSQSSRWRLGEDFQFDNVNTIPEERASSDLTRKLGPNAGASDNKGAALVDLNLVAARLTSDSDVDGSGGYVSQNTRPNLRVESEGGTLDTLGQSYGSTPSTSRPTSPDHALDGSFGAHAEQLFLMADENGDGHLSLEEFGVLLSEGYGIQMSASSKPHELFNALDSHRTGFVEKEDYLAFMRDPQAESVLASLDESKRALSDVAGVDDYLIDLVAKYAPKTPRGSFSMATGKGASPQRRADVLRESAVRGKIQAMRRTSGIDSQWSMGLDDMTLLMDQPGGHEWHGGYGSPRGSGTGSPALTVPTQHAPGSVSASTHTAPTPARASPVTIASHARTMAPSSAARATPPQPSGGARWSGLSNRGPYGGRAGPPAIWSAQRGKGSSLGPAGAGGIMAPTPRGGSGRGNTSFGAWDMELDDESMMSDGSRVMSPPPDQGSHVGLLLADAVEKDALLIAAKQREAAAAKRGTRLQGKLAQSRRAHSAQVAENKRLKDHIRQMQRDTEQLIILLKQARDRFTDAGADDNNGTSNGASINHTHNNNEEAHKEYSANVSAELGAQLAGQDRGLKHSIDWNDEADAAFL